MLLGGRCVPVIDLLRRTRDVVVRSIGRDLAACVGDEARRDGLTDLAPAGAPVTDEDLAPLPETARRYLRYMGVVGRPRDRCFSARLTGRFRLRPGLPWMRMESVQFTTADPVSRIFHMRIDAAGVVPLVGRDLYLAGRGTMHGALLGLVTVVHGEGPELDIGELTTYLNDAVLMAPSMLLRDSVSWTEVDGDRVDLALGDADREVRATLTVDEAGRPVDFSSTDRFVDVGDGMVRARWRTPTRGWSVVDGRPRSRSGSAIWDLDDGPYEYARVGSGPGDIAYDEDAVARLVRPG